jgi:FkbM family methyltransferase
MNKVLSVRNTHRSFASFFIDEMIKNELNKRSAKHNERRNAPIAVFGNDWIGININVEGLYEEEHITDLIQLLKALKIDIAHSSAVDIGANIGNHSIEFSKYFSRVICFEPNPRTFDLLSANTKRLTNIAIHNFGCASSFEKIKFTEDFNNIGGSSSVIDIKGSNEIEILVKPLDDFFDDLSKVELIKIDVEGMEYSALKGAENVISKFHPVICLEQLEAEFRPEYNETEALDWLRSKGYRIFSLRNKKRKSLIIRRLYNIKQLFFGVKENREIIEYTKLPKATYSMVYAIHQSKCI